MKKQKTLFNSGKTIFTPEEWERKRENIEEKAEKYSKKHDLTTEDEQIITERRDRDFSN